MGVFVVAWGVVQHGLLYQDSMLTIWLLRDVIVLPYFQMYHNYVLQYFSQLKIYIKLESSLRVHQACILPVFTRLN